jgi:hypothetical protein
VDVLARFAAAHGVTFPLLSDEASKVIRCPTSDDVGRLKG